MHTSARRHQQTLLTRKTDSPNKIRDTKHISGLASSRTHVDYAFVHMNFVIVLYFSYFKKQYMYVRMNYPRTYVFMYLFFQYLHHGLSAGLWWKKKL